MKLFKTLGMLFLAATTAFVMAGCDIATSSDAAARAKEASITQQNHSALDARCNSSTLVSQEIINLCKRARRINVTNMQSCISLFTQNGALVAFFTVKGKVTALNSYLLPSDAVTYASSYGTAVTEQPDIDGAYGKNPEGIFFFDAATDAYIEWQGDYFWSDQCLKPIAAPLLTRAIVDPAVKPAPAPTPMVAPPAPTK